MKRGLGLVVALVLAVAAVPAGAEAAAPVTIGPGVEPAVTVDPASGTAYIAWIGNEPGTTTLHFCRLPRGAAACDVNAPVAVPGTSLTRPFVTVHGAQVRIFSYRYGLSGPRFDAVYMLTSQDGGVSFDAGVQVGVNAFYDAVEGPGNAVSLVANNSSLFQRAPTDGSGPALTQAHLADDHPYVPSLALTPSGVLAVFANGSGAAQFRQHLTAGDPNDITTWTPAQDFSTYAGYMRLATGPAGTFLLSNTSAGDLVVQHFNGAGFDAPVPLPGPTHPLTGGSDDVAQDPSGRLHVVWPYGDAVGSHVGYATSDDGAKWTATTLEAGPKPEDLAQAPGEMHLSVASDHLGVAVWQDSASAKQVHAMAIGPRALPLPAIGKTANASVVSGKVRVKLRGSSKFVTLSADRPVPLGSTLDTTKGTVALETSAGAGKPLQHGEFRGGQFTPSQTRKNPLTTLSLRGGGLSGCRTRVPSGGSAARTRRRSLVANVSSGRFRTRGRNAAASARRAKWTITDTCGGTLTTVHSGTVLVRDFTLRKNRKLHSGQRYLAHPPPRAFRRGNR
jgi:hypothetical protein